MYSEKKSILQLVALLKAHGVTKIVLCPGSRNAAIIHTLANLPEFTCYSVTDERSAGFFAIGLTLQGGTPAAVCCTSGSALLNLHPAVAEAYYQQVPLLIISADRPAAWIGQMDGQTLPQPNLFGLLVKLSVNLPEVNSSEEEWHCNRLINEAILEMTHHGKGPVHINIPVSEPIYRFGAKELPQVRVITRYQGLNIYDREYKGLIERLNNYSRRLIMVGQMNLIYQFDKKYIKPLCKQFAWMTEHLSNQTTPGFAIKNFDRAIYALPNEKRESMAPQLLITYGGHVVSKQLKKYLEKYPPQEHWHVAADGKVVDLYGSLTTVIEMDPFEFLEKIAFMLENKSTTYPQMWEQFSKQLPEPQFDYSQMAAIGKLMEEIPAASSLHLANSSTVRYAQLFPLNPQIEVCCNRGVNGIEGSLSTALGYGAASTRLQFIAIGDLSFFYDMNALFIRHLGNNIRILLLNNEGGEIFHTLPGMNKESQSHHFITAEHHTSARGWAEERGFTYLSCSNEEELAATMARFTTPEEQEQPLLLEVWTEKERDTLLLKEYFHSLRNKE